MALPTQRGPEERVVRTDLRSSGPKRGQEVAKEQLTMHGLIEGEAQDLAGRATDSSQFVSPSRPSRQAKLVGSPASDFLFEEIGHETFAA